MTDRNAKPFTLFIFGLIFVIMVLTQIFIKSKYESLLDTELDGFTETYIAYTDMVDDRICSQLNMYSVFQSAPNSVYQSMLDTTTSVFSEVEAAMMIFNDGTILKSTATNTNFDINTIDVKSLVEDTKDTVGICKTYSDYGYVCYSNVMYYKNSERGIALLVVPYERILTPLETVNKKLNWVNLIIKDPRANIIYESSDSLEKHPDDMLSKLFTNSDESINEGNNSILLQTRTSQNTMNKEIIGHAKVGVFLTPVEKEFIRRDGLISSTKIGDQLPISVTAVTSLKDFDTNYYTRFIIMLLILVIILIAHLIAGFYIPDKSMYAEFMICLGLYGIVFFTHFTLEVGFLNNIFDKQNEYYSKLIYEITENDKEWTISFAEAISEVISTQDLVSSEPGYNTEMLNSITKQILTKNEKIVGLGIIENGEVMYKYPYDNELSQYSAFIKEAGNAYTYKTTYDRNNDLIVTMTKIRSKLNPNSILLCQFKVNDGTVLLQSNKFDVFGFRDEYSETKLLNLKTDEAIESFVEKVSFDDTKRTETGLKYLDGILYGYVMLPNQTGNINVFRYELTNLYNNLAVYFFIVIILMVIIALFSRRVFNGYTLNQKVAKEDTVYEKLIEKIDQDISDYSDDTLD